MFRPWVFVVLAATSAFGAPEPPLDEAFRNLYNFRFPAAHEVLNRYIAAHPQDPLPYAIRASAYLFYELDRLGILESQFLTSDKRIVDKKELKPDQHVRGQFMQAEEDARSRAAAILATHPNDRRALF